MSCASQTSHRHASGFAKGRLTAAVATVLGIVALAGCGSEKSYAVVTVRMAEGELGEISRFIAWLSNGPSREQLLYYQPKDRSLFRLTPVETSSFSVSFGSSYVGDLQIGVEAKDALDVTKAYGVQTKAIDPGHKIEYDIAIVLGQTRATATADAGVPGGDAAPPVSACQPANPMSCPANRTCFVECQDSFGVGRCTTAGKGKDGDGCQGNADCEPGTQCFRYPCMQGGSSRDMTGICRKFCNDNADCSMGTCSRTVFCDGKATAHKFCLRSCDPRSSVSNQCPGNLSCLLFSGEVTACDCPETRVKVEGQECEFTTECQPGLMCVGAGSPKPVCRPICKRSENDCAADRMCAELLNPKFEIWGACIPRM